MSKQPNCQYTYPFKPLSTGSPSPIAASPAPSFSASTRPKSVRLLSALTPRPTSASPRRSPRACPSAAPRPPSSGFVRASASFARWPFYGQDDQVPIRLLAVWDADQKEPWYLASDLADADSIETLYRWQMRLECANRDEKTEVIWREGGDQHALTNVVHLHRLCIMGVSPKVTRARKAGPPQVPQGRRRAWVEAPGSCRSPNNCLGVEPASHKVGRVQERGKGNVG